MSIEGWAAIADIVSATAVVASLVYLALQIRQNTRGLQLSLKSTELSALQGAYVRQLTYGNDPENFSGSERLLDSLIRRSSVRGWLKRSEPDWRPQFMAMVKRRVQLFEEAAATTDADSSV